jgi:hypothetical protein
LRQISSIDHEILGSDALAVLQVVSLPEQTLGGPLHQRLKEVRPDGWYPVSLLTEVLETLFVRVGPNGLRQMGRKLFAATHESFVKANIASAYQLLSSFDDVYRKANRGTAIGGWKLLDFSAGKAVIEKTTPHICLVERALRSPGSIVLGYRPPFVRRSVFEKGLTAASSS